MTDDNHTAITARRAGPGPGLPPKANPRAQPSAKGRLKGAYTHYILVSDLRQSDKIVLELSGAVIDINSINTNLGTNQTEVIGHVDLALSEPHAPDIPWVEVFTTTQDRVYVLRNNPPHPSQTDPRPR